MLLPIFPQKAEVHWVPESFQVGALGSPTACHEDFGDDGVSQGCSCLKMTSLLPDFKGYADSVVLELVKKLSSPGSLFCHHQPVAILQDMLFGTYHRLESTTVSTDISIPSSR